MHGALVPQLGIWTNTFPALGTSGALAARTKNSAETAMVAQDRIINALGGCTLGAGYVKNPVSSSTIELLGSRKMVL